MQFEFDKKKSNINKRKHGIDFYEAQKLWDDVNYIEIPAKNIDETRFIIIGKILGKYWSGIITYRSKKIRIISVRRSRKKEVELYES
ncbi:MAG: BrnT family toxin [Actinomycetota bacterium]